MAKKKAAGGVTTEVEKTAGRSKAVKKAKPTKQSTKKLKLGAEEHARFMLSHLMGVPGEASTTLGDNAYLSVGIPCPLLFQYLVDISAFPLGLLIQLIGDRGSRKTTLLFEFIRWFAQRGGMAHFALSEGKYSRPLQHAICGLPGEGKNALVVPYVSRSLGDWQVHISEMIERATHAMEHGFKTPDGIVPPGCFSPVIYGIDSLVAQYTEKQAETIEESGGAERGYATHVKAIGEWLSVMSTNITCKPFSLVAINHCSFQQNPITKQVEIKEKGGQRLAYLSSLILCLKTRSDEEWYEIVDGWSPKVQSTVVEMLLTKSSVGDDTRKIAVPVVTRNRITGPGTTMQHTKFQWGRGLVWLIRAHTYGDCSQLKLRKSADAQYVRQAFRDRIGAVVEYRYVSDKEIYCGKYAGDRRLDAEEFGCFLQDDPEFVKVFYELFGIKAYSLWTPGTDFKDFLESIRGELYSKRVLIPNESKTAVKASPDKVVIPDE